LGIVPPAYRAQRLAELEHCGWFAKSLGVTDVCTHIGFVPENSTDPLYPEVVAALKHLAEVYNRMGLRFNLETGQETAVTLLRLLQDTGAANLGLNFDPANLLMYGKANPLDALGLVGRYVNGVHAKDGEYPTDGARLGRETPLGQGSVNIPAFVAKLRAVGYTGSITIEREISGERQKQDVLAANAMLLGLISGDGSGRI
jgi:sugar phosphate isomerase/epimerase